MKRFLLILTALGLLLSMSACTKDTSSVGVIGGADGPTEIIVAE